MRIAQNMINDARRWMNAVEIDYLLIPKNDIFFDDNINKNRIELLSGFTGSNGTLLLSKDDLFLFTDSRYTIQASIECSCHAYDSKDMSIMKKLSLLSDADKSFRLGVFGDLHSYHYVCHFQTKLSGYSIVILESNAFDSAIGYKANIIGNDQYYDFTEYAGVAKETKIANLTSTMQDDAIWVSDVASVCWLLNIRGNNNDTTPIHKAHAIVNKQNNVTIDSNPVNLLNTVKQWIAQDNPITSLMIDGNSTSYYIVAQLLSYNLKLTIAANPIQQLKAVKNDVELDGFRKAHIIDGIALCRLFHWIDRSIANGDKIHEIDVVHKALDYRMMDRNCISHSFDTIAGFGPNGAIIHYNPNEVSSIITGDNVLLLDSGGQYNYGTTDVTRTIAIGDPSLEIKHDFTIVLKCHIALARAIIPYGAKGGDLDAIARYYLWQDKKDYAHSTGHGVGHCSFVHEWPMSISPQSQDIVQSGFVISNEPGYYVKNSHGIRIESLLIANKRDTGYISFETITMVPIDKRMIIASMLNPHEIMWLNNYHENIRNTLSSMLEGDDLLWLQNATSPIS